jgi:vacuolar-type H+-ATPase subunit D/Vma8
MMGMALPKEVTLALKQTQDMAEDIKAMRKLLERLVELEEVKQYGSCGQATG